MKGFGLIELLVAVIILAVTSAIVSLQISKNPIYNARDDIRKVNINSIADAYTSKAIDQDVYKPLDSGDFLSGRIPIPPEGGSYQGLLTQEQDYFNICAQLEKGKDINCLLNSENPNCYCRKSYATGGPIPTPSFSPTPAPTGIGTSSPGPSPTLTPIPSTSPIPTATPTSPCSPDLPISPQPSPGTCSWVADGSCPSGCAAGSDADCCTQKGYYILITGDLYCSPGCYSTNYNSGTQPGTKCSTTSDNTCPNWCAAGSDADCCTQAGKCWTNNVCNTCPIPTPTTTIPVYSQLCPYQEMPQTKPETVSLQGIDGTWCYDSEGMGQDGNYYRVTPGYCMDNNRSCADFCENDYPLDTVRDGHCTGSWWGAFWTNVHCEFGGYVCSSWGQACNEGQSQAYCDPNAAPLPSPTPLPQSVAAKRVFKTSTIYNGNLGGLAGADAKCQDRANAANLGGVWKAWLSDGTSSASSRLNHFNGPYTLLDGTVVSDNWADLTDNTLDRNINMTEFGIIDSNLSNVWTGTDPLGNSTGKHCLNWTTSFGWPYFGGVGSGNSNLSYWTQGASDVAYCSSNYLTLYCFEQ